MQESFTLKANSTQAFDLTGKFLNVISCTAAFKVELDRTGQKTGTAGASFGNSTGFSRVVFTETTGADNAIVFDASETASAGRAQVITSPSGTFLGANSGAYNLGSSGRPFGLILKGIDANGCERKKIYITNTGRDLVGGAASTAVVAVSTGNGICMTIQPGTTQPIETNADLFLNALAQNLASQPANLQAGIIEIFNSKPLQSDQ